jgi:hypothetical protein
VAQRRGFGCQHLSPPIRIIVPLPPGAHGHLMPRILAQHLSPRACKTSVFLAVSSIPAIA